MSAVKEVQPQVDTGRYSVGQKIVAIGHVLKSKSGTYPAAGYAPIRDELVSIHAIELVCIAHQKSPCAYGGSTVNDGYQFRDETTGLIYNNQFPRSANQQLSDSGDWTFTVASQEDITKAQHGMMFLRDVTYIADMAIISEQFSRNAAETASKKALLLEAANHLEKAQILQTYIDRLKAALLPMGYQLDLSPLVWNNKDGTKEADPELLKSTLTKIN